MKAVVIYNSKTGFTEAYARWLAEALQCEAVPFNKRGALRLTDYDAVLYGGGLCAGMIRGAGWFKKAIGPLQHTKKVVFAVGLTPADAPEAAGYLRQNFDPAAYPDVRTFYLPGGLCYEKTGFFARNLLGMLRGSLQKKPDKTPAEEAMLSALSASCDLTSPTYIRPILSYILGEA